MKLTRRTKSLAAGFGLASALALGAAPFQATFASTTPNVEVSSVAFSGSPSAPLITVKGSGFGAAPTGGVSPSTLSDCTSGTHLDYPSGQLWLADATSAGPVWTAGALQGPTFGTCIGVDIHSWSGTKIVFSFGSQYGTQDWTLHGGDGVTVSVKAAPVAVVVPATF
jgi:hypothetical protein